MAEQMTFQEFQKQLKNFNITDMGTIQHLDTLRTTQLPAHELITYMSYLKDGYTCQQIEEKRPEIGHSIFDVMEKLAPVVSENNNKSLER